MTPGARTQPTNITVSFDVFAMLVDEFFNVVTKLTARTDLKSLVADRITATEEGAAHAYRIYASDQANDGRPYTFAAHDIIALRRMAAAMDYFASCPALRDRAKDIYDEATRAQACFHSLLPQISTQTQLTP